MESVLYICILFVQNIFTRFVTSPDKQTQINIKYLEVFVAFKKQFQADSGESPGEAESEWGLLIAHRIKWHHEYWHSECWLDE